MEVEIWQGHFQLEEKALPECLPLPVLSTQRCLFVFAFRKRGREGGFRERGREEEREGEKH